MAEPILEAVDVTKIFGSGVVTKSETIALEDFSLRIDADHPSISAIVGESGSGKTTLVRLLLGLTPPTSGEVRYQGTPIGRLSKGARQQYLKDVQAIFQDPFEVYNPFYKVDHILELPIKYFKLAKNKSAARELMESSLSAVGLRPDETLGRYPHQLSGGQRQRIMVARSLIMQPKVIIADEPVSMVDASLRATILDSLMTLNREFGISLIYITHDLTTAYQISKDVIVLYRGTVAEVGNVERVVPQPEHPYTKLLVGSIPVPDPDAPWLGEKGLGEPVKGLEPSGTSYCRFHQRCPWAMPVCVEQAPPLFRTAEDRATSCFLYRDSPAIESTQLNDVLVGTDGEIVGR
jgi:peptide/nickel transport system ATP-binding protein